ncbi:MAG: N-6 DNA methylase [Trichodesmium sp.]
MLFFTKGKPTENIWYYDLSDIKVTKKNPLTLDKFENFFALLPNRAKTQRSWNITREEIEARDYDLKAVNPNSIFTSKIRKKQELLNLIAEKSSEVTEALKVVQDSYKA